MVTYEKFVAELVSMGIDKSIVERLIDEYRVIKREYFLGDDEKVILHSAKFADLTLALIKNNETKTAVDINNIHFDGLLQEILNYPKPTPEKVLLTLAIPRVAVSVYTIRSKKDVAHVKTIDPSSIDSFYCVSSCDWILSEFVTLFYKSDPKEAQELIESFLKKKVPSIEEFEDESVVILQKGLTFAQELLLILYHFYPRRVPTPSLSKLVKSTNLYSTLQKLEGEKLVHRNSDGNRLTRLGVKQAEDLILSHEEDKD
jgi:hypothetical protein